VVAHFTNAKLAENRIENLLHICDANYFADRSQRLIKIQRQRIQPTIPRRGPFARDRMIPKHDEGNRDDAY